MVEIFPENWAVLHLGLIFCLTLAQLLVVYVLSDYHSPPAGLGLFTVYFMAALLGWLAFTLQQGTSMPMTLDVPAVAAIINSYLLFLAAGQRVNNHAGRLVLGMCCLAGCLSVFFLNPRAMYIVYSALSGLFFAATGLLCAYRAYAKRNVGDGIIAAAAVLMITSVPVAFYPLLVDDNLQLARVITFGAYTWAFTLLAIGFLTSVLVDYQQQLSHLATEDPLTGLLNRRGMEDALRVSMARANREGSQTAAIVIDIDHLKNVNDSFGHETGDSVIREIAALLRRMSRASDVLARIGGEEFMLVIPETDTAAARLVAERICLNLGERPLVVDHQPIPVTVSVGVACSRGDVQLDDLHLEADRAMHLAKRGGGNRVAAVDSKPVHLSNSVKTA